LSTPLCHPACRLHKVCCASLVGRVCRMPHAARCMVRVSRDCTCHPAAEWCGKLESGRAAVTLPQSTLQYPTAAVVGAPRAHCSGMRCRMRWLAQVGVPVADEATEFPPQVRSAPPPAVVARYPRPLLAVPAMHGPSERLPPRSRTHARTWQLSGTHQGAYRWVGSIGVIPPHWARA
jgi:hypothetical protein